MITGSYTKKQITTITVKRMLMEPFIIQKYQREAVRYIIICGKEYEISNSM